MLLDDFIPAFDFSERHEIAVAAPPDAVRRAVEAWRPNESFLWRALLRLRGLGAPGGTLREWSAGLGFLVLAEDERELVAGQIGRFWSPRERDALVSPKTPEAFRAFDDARYAVAAFNLLVEPLDGARTRLSTETRIRALGPSARRRFRLYWLIIRPFSSLLRRSMLSGIRAHAERDVSE